MKKRLLSLALALTVCLAMLPTAAFAGEDEQETQGAQATQESTLPAYSGGSGTQADPWLISTVEDLQTLADTVNAGEDYEDNYFTLTANIDLNNIAWIPIGNMVGGLLFSGEEYRIFAGNFDGKGHTISNISMGTTDTPLESDVFGLFGATAGQISNLNLANVSIAGIAKEVSGYRISLAGALAGSSGGSVENCHVTGLSLNMATPENSYAPAYWIGGLVGVLDGAQHIDECSVSGNIVETSGKGFIGGFIGELGEEGKITYSKADVTLNVKAIYEGGAAVGGFIGKGNGNSNAKTVISNCYATGDITGGTYIGGFGGNLSGLNIKNCYATGNVKDAAAAMATFVGSDAAAGYAYGSVVNCYSVGSVGTQAPNIYAFAQQSGTKRSEFTNCYFVNTNTKTDNESATAKSLEDMQTQDFTNTLNAGDENNGWIFVEGKTPLCGAEPADYIAVDEALAKIPADLTVYTDETVKTLNTAKENAVKGKVIAKQREVKAMAKAIEDAIDALEYKPADYTKVDAAIDKANALNKDSYQDFSAVEKAIDAVVRGKNITEQSEVDAMAKAIEDAIAGLAARPSSSGSSSSSSGSSKPSYSVTAPGTTENGSVTVSPKNAAKGSTVTVTVKPDDGYQLGGLTVSDAKGSTIGVTDKGSGKYTFTMPASKVTVTPVFTKIAEQPSQTGKTFSDVASSDWYADAVRYVAEKKLMNGTSADTFSPYASTTRGMLMTVLARYAGEDTDGGAVWYEKGMNWAKANGVSDGTNPTVNITREQLVTMLYRYADSPAADGRLDGFSDAASVSAYAVNAMQWAVANGIVNGSNGKLNPQNNATRAEVAAILMRFCEMDK